MTPEKGWEEVVVSGCEGALGATCACVFRGHRRWPVVDRGDGARSFFCPFSAQPSSLGGQLLLREGASILGDAEGFYIHLAPEEDMRWPMRGSTHTRRDGE